MLPGETQKRLKRLAHVLKPVVMIGNKGLSENVLKAVDEALLTHELIKVKVAAEDRDARDSMIESIVNSLECDLVQRIGHIAVLYKERQEALS